MQRQPRSHDYYAGNKDQDMKTPSQHHFRQGGYHSMPGISSYIEDTDLDHLSTSSGHSNLNSTSHHVKHIGSSFSSTPNDHHSKRNAPNYMDNLGSYCHSTLGEKDGKRSTHQHSNDMSTDYYTPDRKQYRKRNTNKHLSVLGLYISTSESTHHGKKSTYHHTTDKQVPHPKTLYREAGGKAELRESLFQQALQPFNKNTSSPYPCSQTEIDFHQRNVFPTPNQGPFVTSREATKEVMWQNDIKRPIPPSEKAAVKRLLFAASRVQKGFIPGPDLAIKAFADLDLVFFAGRLRTNVTVQWRPDILIPCRAWGICNRAPRRDEEEGQCRIELNAGLIFKEGWTTRTQDPFESMIGTLLHEMCHAYENVRAPHDVERSIDGHGRLFGTRIAVVHERALRILGLWAIERGEKHRQNHFFMPGCLEGNGDQRDGKGCCDEGGKKVASGKMESKDQAGSSGKRNHGLKADHGKKAWAKAEAGGLVVKAKNRQKYSDEPKGGDCLVM